MDEDVWPIVAVHVVAHRGALATLGHETRATTLWQQLGLGLRLTVYLVHSGVSGLLLALTACTQVLSSMHLMLLCFALRHG